MSNLEKKVTIQIVLYEENYDLLKRCLMNLEGFKIIIVHNKNNYNLKQKIERNFNIEKYILKKSNVGFSKGHNEAAFHVTTEFILIMNADCLIDKQSIQILVDTIEKDNKCGIVSPTTFDRNGNLTYNGGVFPERGSKNFPLNLDGDVCVDSVLGSSMLINLQLFLELGGFDENFFLYFSDDHLCKKIRNKKLSIIQSFNAKAIHIHGISKVNNFIKKLFLREFNFTYDEMYYYHCQKLKIEFINKNKKKKNKYLFKFFLSLFILNLPKVIIYIARFLAIRRFEIDVKN